MLNENIKAIRKSKGLSQQDLADKLNVVRQTISKWEQGCSLSDILIPDAPEKYFLSSEQTGKLLYKSSEAHRAQESMTPEGPPAHRLPEAEEKE